MHLLIIACLFLIVKGELSTNVNQCATNFGELPLNIYILNCINPPCQVVRGEDVIVNAIFKAPRTMRTMKTLARAMSILDYDLGDNANTCNFLENTYCPVLRDEVVQYTLRMHIESWFPLLPSVNVMFRVVDEYEEPVWCINTNIAVVSSSRSLPSNGTSIV